jgi:two-component system, LytTR family, response regulator
MIRAIHIEDEPGNVALLQSLVTAHCADMVTIIGNADNLHDAFDLIKKEKPQLVYLDIEINQGNAFDLLEKVKNTIGIQFEIIFITAFNNYAIKAFKQNAIDYILKPISTAELKQATQKAVEKITYTTAGQNVLALLSQLKQNAATAKIGLSVADGLYFLNPDDIIRIEAKGSYTIIYLTNGKNITSTQALRDVEDLLPNPQFLRVHNSWLVNSKQLKKYYKGKDSYIEMEDNSIVPVSLRKKGDFLDMM